MINQQLIVENLPQAFSPNSRALKNISLENAKEALTKAKQQNKTVIRVKQGACAFSLEIQKSSKKRPTMLEQGYFTTKQAAEEIGISTDNILAHKRLGNITPEKINGRLYFTSEEVERFKNTRNKNQDQKDAIRQ